VHKRDFQNRQGAKIAKSEFKPMGCLGVLGDFAVQIVAGDVP
jgi:hypothetical protein